MKRDELPRPKRHLVEAARRYPRLWKRVDEIRGERGRSYPDWPEWCFCPDEFIYQEEWRMDRQEGAPGHYLPLNALAAWRVTQGVYRFDGDVLEAVWDTPIEEHFPTDPLYRLPEWCVYVETPGRELPTLGRLHGFFARLDYAPFEVDDLPPLPSRAALDLVFDLDSGFEGEEIYLTGHLPKGADTPVRDPRRIEEAHYLRAQDRTDPRIGAWVAEDLARQATTGSLARRCLSLLLYLCSVSAEYHDAAGADRRPRIPVPKKTKKGPRFFPPDKPTVWETGYRMGAALRTARAGASRGVPADAQEGAGRTAPRPHMRRAHWHAFWSGPKDKPEERRLKVKWLPPVAVNIDDNAQHDRLPAVARNVEGAPTRRTARR